MTTANQPWCADDPRLTPVMLRGQLLDEGYDDKAIARLVRAGAWVRVRRGAYADAGRWSLLDTAGRHAVRARAVLAQGRTDLVLSHVTGLPEYDAPTWGLDLSSVHVTRADGRAGRAEAGVRQHRGVVAAGDVVTRNGVPVMTATRLALETTTVAPVEPSLVVVNDLLHRGLTSPAQLEAGRVLMDQWPGSLSTDLVLRLADARVESAGETRLYYLCYRQGLPAPQPQYAVRGPDGDVIARLDFAWPAQGLFVEFDGRVKYEQLLRPGERASDVVVREKRREELVCRLTGWRCLRLVWADLERPEQTAALIRSMLSYPGAAA